MNRGVDREAVVERLLRESFKAAGEAKPRGQCLDAEMLAAWVDGGLTGDERTATEAHLSDCTRCLSVVATMLKSSPAPEPVARWWGSGTLRWVVPLAAGAAALLVWIAVPSDRTEQSQEQTLARTEAIPVAPSIREPATERRPQTEADDKLRFRSLEKSSVDKPVGRNDDAAKPAEGRQALKESEPARQERAALSELEANLKSEREAPAAPPPAAASPAPPSSIVAGATEPGARAADADQRATSTGETTANPRAAPASLAARSADLRRATAAVAMKEILSPNSTVRWRAGARGVIQLSQDGGTTWESLDSGVTVDLIAGASPSPTVCWVVGRLGAVLLTSDGRNWRRLTFPDSSDLTSVRASDARNATVTAADGRSFTTTDGGLTWTR